MESIAAGRMLLRERVCSIKVGKVNGVLQGKPRKWWSCCFKMKLPMVGIGDDGSFSVFMNGIIIIMTITCMRSME